MTNVSAFIDMSCEVVVWLSRRRDEAGATKTGVARQALPILLNPVPSLGDIVSVHVREPLVIPAVVSVFSALLPLH